MTEYHNTDGVLKHLYIFVGGFVCMYCYACMSVVVGV